MRDGPNITTIAALIGDHARAQALTLLLGGQALTATELADAAGVTRQTISTHLAQLVGAGLLAVTPQGRHRYFRICRRRRRTDAGNADGFCSGRSGHHGHAHGPARRGAAPRAWSATTTWPGPSAYWSTTGWRSMARSPCTTAPWR